MDYPIHVLKGKKNKRLNLFFSITLHAAAENEKKLD